MVIGIAAGLVTFVSSTCIDAPAAVVVTVIVPRVFTSIMFPVVPMPAVPAADNVTFAPVTFELALIKFPDDDANVTLFPVPLAVTVPMFMSLLLEMLRLPFVDVAVRVPVKLV